MTGNWWFPLDVWVVVQPNLDLKYYSPGVVGALYVPNGAGAYTSPPGAFDSMVQNADGTWTRTTKAGAVWHFNIAGYLDFIRTRYGRQTTIHRGPANQVLGWSDYAGRAITVSYFANGYASAIIDWGGRQVSFTYTPQGYLASVTYPATTFWDGAVQQVVTRGKTLTFQYTFGTGTALDGNIVQVFDDSAASALSNTYDALDRSASTTSRGRTWTHQYLASGATRVIDPDNVTVDYSFSAAGYTTRKEVWTRTGLGLTPLRTGEPNSYVWQYERTSACNCGLVTKIIRPDTTTVAFAFDSWGNVTSRTRSDASGTSSLTSTSTYAPFFAYCRMLTHTTPAGNAPGASAADYTYTATYDSSGSLVQLVYPKASVGGIFVAPTVLMIRDVLGRITSYFAPDGTRTAYSYAPTTLELTQMTQDPGGLNITTQFAWDGFSRLVGITSPRGYVTGYEYNALNQITKMTGLGAPDVTWLRDQNENIYRTEVENRNSSGVIDASNPWITSTNVYNANNRLARVDQEIDASAVATTFLHYTAGGRLSAVIDPNGNRTENTYDERGLPFGTTAGAGTALAGTTTSNYDVVGRQATDVGPLGTVTTFAYDYADRLLAVTSAGGRIDTAVWDANGHKTMFTSSVGGTVLKRSRWTFDPLGQTLTEGVDLLSAAGALIRTPTTTFGHDAALRVVSVVLPTGEMSTYDRDAIGRVMRAWDPVQGRVEYAYDADGHVTQTIRKDWNPVSLQLESIVEEIAWDALGRASSRIRHDAGGTVAQLWTRAYDGLSRVVGTADPLGNTASYVWDARGALLSTTRDLRVGGTGAGAVTGSIQTTSAYDSGGRVLTRLDALAHATTLAYDARGRIVSTTSAGGTSTFVHDAASNVVSYTDPVGTSVTSGYNVMGWLTSHSVARAVGVLGTTAETYQYDAMGRLTLAIDDDSTVARTYDSLDRTTSETQNGKTFSYAYDDSGRLTSVTYPDGTVENRQVDASGRLMSVAIQGGPTLATYQSVGRRALTEALGNGVVRMLAYDALWRPTSIDYTLGAASLKKFTYAWTSANQRAYEKRHHAGGTGDNYGFDSLYRRIQVKVGVVDPAAEFATPGSQAVASTHAIDYNAASSRTQVVVTGAGAGTTGYTSDGLNFYSLVGGATHARDASGNRRDDGVLLFAYDYRNQLVEIRNKASGTLVATYEYDTNGRRTSKTVGSATRTFAWMGLEMGAEYDAVGLYSRRHYGAETAQVAAAWQRGLLGGSSWVYPLYDGAFDCVGLSGPGGVVVESYVFTYDGAVTITGAAGNLLGASAFGWQQGYARYYRDDETGLLYATLRYYDPDTGRFITEDPIGRWGDGANLGNGYAFLANNYRNGFDPFGLYDASKCPCGQAYGVIHITRAEVMAIGMTPETWGEAEQLAYGAAVRKALAALTKHYGTSRVRIVRDDEVDPAKRASTEFREATGRLLQELTKEDPCRETQVMFGHGYIVSRTKESGYYFFDLQLKSAAVVAPGVRLLAFFSCFQLPADFTKVADSAVLYTDTPSSSSRPGETPAPGELRPDAYDGHAQKIAEAIGGLR